jgi:hypothetical protein
MAQLIREHPLAAARRDGGESKLFLVREEELKRGPRVRGAEAETPEFPNQEWQKRTQRMASDNCAHCCDGAIGAEAEDVEGAICVTTQVAAR